MWVVGGPLVIACNETTKNTKCSVYTSSVIDAPVDKVWLLTRDFGGFSTWHSAVSRSFIEGDDPPDRVGCIRRFTLVTGETVRERLLALCDVERVFRYALLDGPLPLRDYVATFRLRPVTEGDRTFISWKAKYYTHADAGVSIRSRIEDLFQQGFDTLKRQLA